MKKVLFICTLLAVGTLAYAQQNRCFEIGLNYGFAGVNSQTATYHGFMPSVNGGWWFNEYMYAGAELGYVSQLEGGSLSVVFRGAHAINDSPCTLICDFTAGFNFGSGVADDNPYGFQFLPGIQFPISSKMYFRIFVGAHSVLDDDFENGTTSCIIKGSVVF